MAAYATAADLALQYDERTLKDLCVDDGTPETNLSANAKVSWALELATGEINAAINVAGIYTADDMAALTDESLTYLKSICCELAVAHLILRRPENGSDHVKGIREGIEATLDRFRTGERVFAIDKNIQAGLPTIDGPTAVDYQRLNLIPSRTRNFYPNVPQRLPLGRG